jgi:hypothetical protein
MCERKSRENVGEKEERGKEDIERMRYRNRREGER